MAYKDWFVTNNFEYIFSLKEVAFHIAFIVISILGLVVSVALFPTIYKRKWLLVNFIWGLSLLTLFVFVYSL